MSKKKQDHLEPKLRPVHKINSSLETMGEQDPPRMCAQGYPSEWCSSWLIVEIQTAKDAMGMSSIVGFYSTSANYTENTF